MQSRAILVISCDKYSDLWQAFFELYWKNWPSCPYRVYLGSNTKKFSGDKRVTTILSGKDIDWSTSFKKILKQIPEKNLLVWPDDGFIISQIDNSDIKRCFDFLVGHKGKNIHCRPPPKPSSSTSDRLIGVLEKGVPYRVNLEGFWDKDYLYNMVVEGESPWNFEIMGSYRTSYDDGFYCTKKPLFKFIHMVEKGKYVRSCVNYCEMIGLKLDHSKRETLNFTHEIYNALLRAYVNIIFSIDWRLRLKIMNILRKLLVSY